MSATQTIPCGPTPTILLRSIEGNLTLNGWDRPEVQARVRGDALKIEQLDGAIATECEDDLWLQVPVRAATTPPPTRGHPS